MRVMQSCAMMMKSNHLSRFFSGYVPLALASLSIAISPANAETSKSDEGIATHLGAISVSLKETVQFNWGFQAQTQGDGTPNQLGIGAFIPLTIRTNSLFFLDALANANLADINNISSIVGPQVDGITISTSTRLGYRWLNGKRAWMFGFNAGYDSRPLMVTDTISIGKSVLSGSRSGYFQQVAAGLEAASDNWRFDAYALIPVGTTDYTYVRNGGALDTYGIDTAYNVSPDLKASAGYYYQQGDLGTVNGSGVRGRLAYTVADGLTVGANLSYDQAFDTRFSADIKYRFSANGYGSPQKQKNFMMPVIQALSATPSNRDVRVHDSKWVYPVPHPPEP
jgi:hypothetical protein